MTHTVLAMIMEPEARFAVTVDGRTVTADRAGTLDGTAVLADWAACRIGAGAVWELTLELINAGDDPVTITRMDPLAGRLTGPAWRTLAFRSAWGDEFAPVRSDTGRAQMIETRSGRSSHGMTPWLGLDRDDQALIIAPAWSGNWRIELDDDHRIAAGISPWRFATELAPGERVTAPSVIIATGSSLEDAATELTDAIGRHWIPRSAASDAVPVEWNHWWPYEDAEVTEQVILDNAAVAAELGIEVSTVDAGWFGDADAQSDWQLQRGDWDRVNTARFPSGLAALGAGIRDRGTKAGIWIELEAIGAAARVRREQPAIVARADGERAEAGYRTMTVSLDPDDPSFLGYVCLGSPEGRAFATETLERTITELGAEWVKIDFNIDPDAGCTRVDHGHGPGDGLFRHYQGLYSILDEFRERHPEVIVESCSSGGLRLDLGLARHVHCFFLSDPDYTEHHLQVLWGAGLMLPPAAILHWSWSQWRNDYPQSQLDFDTVDPDAFDTMLRAAMLHRFGVSLRLPELRDDHRERLRWHVELFREVFAPFVRGGTLRRLTGQPLRGGAGERTPVFQLSLGDRHLVLGFRLAGGSMPESLPITGIDPAERYRVTDLATGSSTERSGDQLADTGLLVESPRPTISSWLLLVEPPTSRTP